MLTKKVCSGERLVQSLRAIDVMSEHTPAQRTEDL